MAAIWGWVRLDLRRRWRSLVVLALLVAVAGGTVLAAFAGAHRGATAGERLREETLPIDAVIVPNTPGFDWVPFRELDYVTALSEFALGSTPAVEGHPELLANSDFLHADDEYGRTLERPVVLEGRLWDPSAPDEAVVSAYAEEKNDIRVGDVLTVHLTSPEQVEGGEPDALSLDEYAGPVLDVTVVGVVRSPWMSDHPGSDSGGISYSPGLFAAYRENFMGADGADTWLNAQVRLDNGAADIPQLRADLERITGRSDIDVWDYSLEYAEQQRSLDFEAGSLLAFGAAALLAGLFLVGQAIARYAAAEAAELATARALGMSPRQVVVAAAAAPGAAAAVGAVTAAAAAVVASRWFPIGSASVLEPDPGPDVDWPVIVVGAVVLVVLATAAAAASATFAARSAAGGRRSRPSPVATTIARAGLPVPVLVGARFAFERGVGRAAVPVRPALFGAVAGVLGVLAALSFSAGVDDTIDHPERFGQTYQALGFYGYNGADFAPVGKIVDEVRSLDYVTGVDDAPLDVATTPDGEVSVELWSYDTGDKALPTVVKDGRMPETAGEVLLAPGTLDALGIEVGDPVELVGSRTTAELTVVGAGFVPVGPHNGYNEGGFLTANGFDALFDDFKFHVVFVSVDPGSRTDDLTDRLSDDVVAAQPDLAGTGPLFQTPGEVGLDVTGAIALLRQVRVLPLALGLFLAALAVAAVGHGIATAVTRRSHDLAVFRAVGMTPWQSRLVVVVQATALVLVGLAFGVPLGVALGRSTWRVVADYTPFEYVAPSAVLALALIGPVALLTAYVVAAWPAVRASRVRVATILRAE